MQLFKDDESWFDIVVKSATMISIGFAVWAYFNTVHPRFKKENELSALQVEVEKYTSEKEKILNELATIRVESNAAIKQVGELKLEREMLQVEIQQNEKLLVEQKALVSEKKQQINSLLSENKDAGHIAIQAKLEKIAVEINSKYLNSISYRSESFDLVSICNEIYETESRNIDNAYEKKALSFFRNYIDTKAGKVKTGKEVIHFAVYLPFEYQLDADFGFNKRSN